MRTHALMIAAASLAIASSAQAETFAARGVDIVDAAANLTIIPEDRADIAVESTAGARLGAPAVRRTGDRVVIDGGLDDRIRGCTDITLFGGGGTSVVISGMGSVRTTDLPRVTVRVPRNLDLNAGGAVYLRVGASNGGKVSVSGCGETDMAVAGGALEATQNGSGDFRIASVRGPLNATLNGSGALDVGAVSGPVVLTLNGSGDMNVRALSGMLTVAAVGSGAVSVGDGAQEAGLRLNGSGDVDVGAVNGGISAALNGSGAMDVAAVHGGHVQLVLDGSGDLSVQSGEADQLTIRNSGPGNVDFDGRAGSARISLTGSGDIEVAHVDRIETLEDRGSGNVDFN